MNNTATAALREFAETMYACLNPILQVDKEEDIQGITDKLTALINEHSILYHKWLQKRGYTNIKHSHKECIEEYLTELRRNEGN